MTTGEYFYTKRIPTSCNAPSNSFPPAVVAGRPVSYSGVPREAHRPSRRGVAALGTPRFPDIKRPASLREIMARLLETVALAARCGSLINSEAEKVQAVVKAGVAGPVSPEELKEINITVSKVLETTVAAEERMQKKLRMILAQADRMGTADGAPSSDFDDGF